MTDGMSAYKKDLGNPLYEENFQKIDWKQNDKEKSSREVVKENGDEVRQEV